MPSLASNKFFNSITKAQQLYRTSHDSRLRPISQEEKDNFLHASLALIVASWDSYLKNVIKEFYDNVSSPLDRNFNQIYLIAKGHMLKTLERFNTPNADNSRVLLLTLTAYDPIGDWVWIARGYTGQQTREFLNQVLKVRHSFAHGFPMPSYPWTTSSAGKIRLTVEAVKDCEKLISFLVNETDLGLKTHQQAAFGLAVW